MADTTKELIPMLETALELEERFDYRLKIERIIDKAKVGHYHDYKSTITFPKLQLIDELIAVELEDIADLVMSGDFDEKLDGVEQVMLKRKFYRA